VPGCRLDTWTEFELVVVSVLMHVPLTAVLVASRLSITCSGVGAVEEPVRATQQERPAVLDRRLTVTELVVEPPLAGAVVHVGVTRVGMALLVTEFRAFVSPSVTSKLLRVVKAVPVTLAWSVGLGDSLKRFTSRVYVKVV
jgi:hypothetical protein